MYHPGAKIIPVRADVDFLCYCSGHPKKNSGIWDEGRESGLTKDEIIMLAAKGGPLPEGLDPADTFLFMALRSLYLQARHTNMGKDQGAKEKRAILTQHEKMKLWIRVVEEHRRKEREFESAWETFAKDPTKENADNLHRAWFNCGIKPNTDGLTDE